MIKYIEDMTDVVFAEVPDKVALAFNISNCQNNCPGCFEAFLKKNIGKELTKEEMISQIKKNSGIEVVLFMGEGNDQPALKSLANVAKNELGLETALYSGRTEVEDELYEIFDYIKVGPYNAKCGPLDKETTNQRMYHMINGEKKDITYKFWRKPWDTPTSRLLGKIS